jgi:flagellar M-ring protein FliF
LSILSNRIDFRVLYSNLSDEDAAAIVAKLKELKVPYSIEAGGHSILVPTEKVYDTRLQLATSGLPQGGGVGFEIFDRVNFGVTDFVQKLNYQRALQGELSRTINQFSEVEKSRIHLSLPEKSLFVEEQKEARASVIVTLREGRTLNRSQVRGIVHLVASSVEGLNPGNVTVVDTNGNVLSEGEDNNPAARLNQSQWEFQNDLERTLEKRVQTMLEKAVGSNRATVRVSADLDFKQVEETEENFDPNATVVRSEQRAEEKSQGGYSAPSGVPGVRSNVPPGEAPSTTGKSSTFQKSNETINYEVNRKTRRTVAPIGQIRKLSVAVLLDGTYEKSTEKGSNEKVKYIPRSAEELKQYESVVRKAVGYNAERGDQIEVASIPFQQIGTEEEGGGGWDQSEKQRLLSTLIRHGMTVLPFLLFFLFALRPMIKWLTLRHGETEVQKMLPQRLEDLEAKVPYLAGPEERSNRQKLIELAQTDSKAFARMVETWLK